MRKDTPLTTTKPMRLLAGLAFFLLTLLLAGGVLQAEEEATGACICSGEALQKTTAAAEAGEQGPRDISPQQSCPTCGMHPQRYPKWHAQIVFTDGSMEAFDGCRCMFRFLLSLEKHRKNSEEIAAVWVRDFNSNAWIDGTAAHYVVDSAQMGPMGRELLPFAAREAAEEFRKARGGTVMAYQEIGAETISGLMGHGQGRHHGGH